MSKRWEIFTVLALVFMLGFFYRVSMAVAARDLSVDLDLSAVQLDSFPRSPAGYPPQAYHGAFLIPICGLAGTLVLFTLFRGGAAKIKS